MLNGYFNNLLGGGAMADAGGGAALAGDATGDANGGLPVGLLMQLGKGLLGSVLGGGRSQAQPVPQASAVNFGQNMSTGGKELVGVQADQIANTAMQNYWQKLLGAQNGRFV